MAKAVRGPSRDEARPGPTKRPSFYDTPFGLFIFNAADYVIRFALFAMGVAIIYLVIGVCKGDLAHVATVQAALKYRIASLLLAYSLVLVYLAALARHPREELYLYVFLVVGCLMHFGLPLGLDSILARQGATITPHNPGVAVLLSNCFLAGKALFFIAAFQLGYFIYVHFESKDEQPQTVSKELDRIVRLSGQMPKKVQVRKGPFAPCWELPHCIDYIKEVCDAWKVKKACWRLDTGCMCNMSYLAQSLQLQGQKGTLAYDAVASAEKTIEQFYMARQVQCNDCRIYQEHQRRKFRYFSPMGLPITIFLIWLLHPVLLGLYTGAVHVAARALKVLSFSTQAGQRTAEVVNMLSEPAIAWIVIGIFGLFLLSGVMRFIEWLILDLKL